MNVVTLILILILIAALGVVLVKDPIHSVIFLVISFIYSAILFYVMGAEFLAVLFMTVYIGAIAVLFLFVVMLLNLRMVELYTSLYYHLPVGMVLGMGLVWLVYYVFSAETGGVLTQTNNLVQDAGLYDKYADYLVFTGNIAVLGEILYNYYIDLFIIAGVILFIGMVGVIILTVNLEPEYRPVQQRISEKTATRSVESNIIWENINVITKDREYPWYRDNSHAISSYLLSPDITKIKLIPYLHLPKFIKRWMSKNIKES